MGIVLAAGAAGQDNLKVITDYAVSKPFSQRYDFFDRMKAQKSPLESVPNNRYTYEQLAQLPSVAQGQPTIKVEPTGTSPYLKIGPKGGGGGRDGEPVDMEDIFAGYFHCFPAAAAAMMEVLGQKAPYQKLAKGVKTIPDVVHEMALAMKTNGLSNPNATERLYFGTSGANAVAGLSTFVTARDDKLKVTAEMKKFDIDVLKARIDADKPVLITASENPTRLQGMTHAYLAIGYEFDGNGTPTRLLVRNPWRLTTDPVISAIKIPQAVGAVETALERTSGLRSNSYGDIGITEVDHEIDDFLYEGAMIDMDITAVPEPSTLLAFGVGGLILGARRKKKGRAAAKLPDGPTQD